jgi:HK97 family phage portal protein
MGLLTRAAKALGIYGYGQGAQFLGWDGTILGTRYGLLGERNYQRDIGDGKGTNLVVIGTNWIMREFPAAPPALWDAPDEKTIPQLVRQHELVELLKYPTANDPTLPRMPRGYYSGRVLMQATAAEFAIDGNAYWWKRRDGLGRVRQLWWLPTLCTQPLPFPETTSTFVWKYRYSVLGQTTDFDPWDIVHFRFGSDPLDPRKGLSAIRGLYRELYGDEEAARTTAAYLRNVGLPGLVIIPGENVKVDDEGAKEIKARVMDEFTADKRGEPIVLRANAKVETVGWSPKDLDLSSLRDVPEERLSAALGIPAAVLGLGTGLQQVKVGATMRELRAQGWEGAVLPMAENFAAEINTQLLHEFVKRSELQRYTFGFDFSRVPVLLEYHKRRVDVEVEQLRSGIKMRSEARGALGLPVDAARDDIFLPQPGVVAGAAPAPTEVVAV